MEKANQLLPDMIKMLISDFDRLYAEAKPQGEGEYWKAPCKTDFTVTADMTVEEADLILRAFYGYECIYADGDSKQVIIGGRAVKSEKAEGKGLPLADGYIKY